jgi:cyclohexadieny/prephenate dehydrogenase
VSEEAAAGSGQRLGRVAVIGAGQIGTALGTALRRAGEGAGVEEVALFDRDVSAARASLRRGGGDRVLARREDALEADTVILAVPVPAIVQLIEQLGPGLPDGAVLIDTGSAKRVVVEAMKRSVPESVHALGGHPMAGTEEPGPAGARPEALQDATFVLTPVRPDPHALERGRALARAVGARPFEIDAATHDRVVARTSHVPHVMAFALAAMDLGAGDDVTHALTSTGYLGATRLANSDPDMVAGFLWANAFEVRAALTELIDGLNRTKATLDQDPVVLSNLLRNAPAPEC